MFHDNDICGGCGAHHDTEPHAADCPNVCGGCGAHHDTEPHAADCPNDVEHLGPRPALTVRQLIERLQQMPQDAPAAIEYNGSDARCALPAVDVTHDNGVVLIGSE